MGILKKIIFELKLLKADPYQKWAVYAKYMGVNFGKGVRITGKPSFGSEPYLITIGDDVTIAHGVTFHTHDGGVGVLRKKYPGINIFKKIVVGNNVFIGSHATILPGIVIGNNVIIGASSLVSKNIPDNTVVAGVPAKKIKTLEEYEEKVLQDAVYLLENDPQKRIEKIKEFAGNK
ncbi:acyltransferase [Mucilaginibacter sp. CAU 1740]|uniref:acyltransferase n=1 Tax=Mucilaginibacter sp. CAU 1740 TaxID=3140365 RepID=UPI00325B1B99